MEDSCCALLNTKSFDAQNELFQQSTPLHKMVLFLSAICRSTSFPNTRDITSLGLRLISLLAG